MDSKGLGVCNSLECKECWRCCCPDARKAACHDDLDSLIDEVIVCLRSLRAPAQYIATKQGEEAQTGPAEYLAALAIMPKGQYSLEAQCSLPCLTTWTAASAHQSDQCMQDQSSPNILAPNRLWGNWTKADLPQPLCIFKICRGCTNCRPNFGPDLDKKKRDGLHLSWPVVCTSWTA